MTALYIITGIVIGTALSAIIFYTGYSIGYKAGRSLYEDS